MIKAGDRVRVVRISKSDACYGERNKFIGEVCTVTFATLYPGGYYFMECIFDNGRLYKRVFYRVQVKKV